MRIGVVGNAEYAELGAVVERVRNHVRGLGAGLAFDDATGALADGGGPRLQDAWDEVDCLLTLGGDGTLLRGARQAGPRGIPVMGCNLGRLGFLTSAPEGELERALERLVEGDYRVEERVAMDVSVEGKGGESGFYALNDAVVHKSGFARLITLRVWVDGEEVGQYSADGIVIATATGSTAYSLSAGGPVLVPDLDALVATPISPHTLAVRPLVVPADALIEVEVRPRREETIVTVDGQAGLNLEPGDRVRIGRSPHPVRLIQLPGQTFFSILRRKLGWGDVRPRER